MKVSEQSRKVRSGLNFLSNAKGLAPQMKSINVIIYTERISSDVVPASGHDRAVHVCPRQQRQHPLQALPRRYRPEADDAGPLRLASREHDGRRDPFLARVLGLGTGG